MRVRTKLISIVLFVALVPISISAYTMLTVHQESFGEKLTELHLKTAELGAAHSQSNLEGTVRTLSALIQKRIDWTILTDVERTQVLWLVYEQVDNLAVVSLLDDEGRGIGTSVYRDAGATIGSLRQRQVMANEELVAYGNRVPVGPALRDGKAIGQAVPPSGDRGAIIPIAFAVAGAGGTQWIVSVGLSLTPVCKQLAQGRARDTGVSLLDARGAQLCSGEAGSAKLGERLAAALPVSTATSMRYDDVESADVLAAAVPAGSDWTIVTTQLASSAFAPQRRIQLQLVFWIVLGVLGAILAGVFLARGITRPIASLSEATKVIAGGNYEIELKVEGRDEFAMLATTFNSMRSEIQSWNQELTKRVDERTQELTEAQGQLLESKKMSALASMSAGVAHEINNPLTAVITLAQVMANRAQKDPSQSKQLEVLKTLTDSALRIRDIVQRMQRLSEQSNQGMTDQRPLDIIEAATSAIASKLEESRIRLVIKSDPELPCIYVHRALLQHAIAHILDNSINAMQGERRELGITIARIGDALVRIEIQDTGKGIPSESLPKIFEPFFTLKDDWQGQGLGLAEAHQVIVANHGTIKARSAVGEGTTMTLTFPAATQRAHLV